MEHEVFVPVPAESLRRVLADPARVARCVPGFQQDADGDSGPLAGRLKVRVGGHTITYRGALRIGAQDGGFAVEGEGTEARGSGVVKLSLTVRLSASDGGTTLTFAGTARGEGRLAELDDASALASAQRLLDRFADRLGAEPVDEPAVTHEEPQAPEEAAPEEAAAPTSVFETEVPPPSLDALAEVEFEPLDLPVDMPHDDEPAEAAHARRTMIGRSAEEVDHAPPRGRYAPVPPPASATASATLRWAAPAAALALASAVVVGRALRRRR
ncbi:SRPBCC family protein [Streptomyces sp. NBC_01465]|uniref:SRPBCC family protein n=1 Tax=Streptomyces sp. NBC_01465 TaxID=2903878 RepID=UPI002E319DE9|nr:SRPBCC domain-containing protein [Streptomyces sp. NBC_01465]